MKKEISDLIFKEVCESLVFDAEKSNSSDKTNLVNISKSCQILFVKELKSGYDVNEFSEENQILVSTEEDTVAIALNKYGDIFEIKKEIEDDDKITKILTKKRKYKEDQDLGYGIRFISRIKKDLEKKERFVFITKSENYSKNRLEQYIIKEFKEDVCVFLNAQSPKEEKFGYESLELGESDLLGYHDFMAMFLSLISLDNDYSDFPKKVVNKISDFKKLYLNNKTIKIINADNSVEDFYDESNEEDFGKAIKYLTQGLLQVSDEKEGWNLYGKITVKDFIKNILDLGISDIVAEDPNDTKSFAEKLSENFLSIRFLQKQ